MNGEGIDRRRLLLRGLSMIGGLGGAGLLARSTHARSLANLAQPALWPNEAGRTLVLLQLSGGNDGLSTVIPHGDDRYHRSRNATRHEASEVLRIDGYRGLHPNLERMRVWYDEGRLAIIEGCGYVRPSRSHFKSLEIWHTARAAGRNSGDGWVGRLCESAFAEDFDAKRVVHVGGTVPYSLHSAGHPASSFVIPEGYRWVGNESDIDSFSEAKREEDGKGKRRKNASLDHLRSVMNDARASSAAIRTAAARYRPTVEYPNDPFAEDLRTCAALIDSDIGTRILSLELRGFDTHSGQKGVHDNLMRRLDEGLSAFLADLEASQAGRRTIVMAFSEFGRRVTENASRGTDHGTAGPMFVAGHDVRGGLYGRHPSLQGLDGQDLVFTTDFRTVYATLIEACFGVKHDLVLGARYPTLNLVA
ncbi:MAG: DUF1501 domain-containing protein [Planctomycetota bacterium]|nr:DUF1501 domain-containing protein [Planctomycetota bacterium]